MTRPQELRAAIADDEPAARWHLRGLLEICGVRTVAECATGSDVLAAIARVPPDLVCLDVRMPDADGIEVARALVTRRHPAIVFTTGYPDYAAAAFDLDAVDYLLKPLTLTRVAEAVLRVRSRLRLVSPPVQSTVSPARILIPVGDHHRALAPETIRFIEARRGGCLVHADDRSYPVGATLATLERALAPCGFFRTHRAYLVNIGRVRAVVTWSRHAHSLLLDTGKETHVPVAKSRLAAFRRNVIWIAKAGGLGDGSGPQGQGSDRGRREPGIGPGDR